MEFIIMMYKRTLLVLPLLLLLANYTVAKDATPAAPASATSNSNASSTPSSHENAAADVKSGAAALAATTGMPHVSPEIEAKFNLGRAQKDAGEFMAMEAALEYMQNPAHFLAVVAKGQEHLLNLPDFGDDAAVITAGLASTCRNMLELRKRRGGIAGQQADQRLATLTAYLPQYKAFEAELEKMLTDNPNVGAFQHAITLPTGHAHQLLLPRTAWRMLLMLGKGAHEGFTKPASLPDCLQQISSAPVPAASAHNITIAPVPGEFAGLLDMGCAIMQTVYQKAQVERQQKKAALAAAAAAAHAPIQ
jgi:hypothetical protein